MTLPPHSFAVKRVEKREKRRKKENKARFVAFFSTGRFYRAACLFVYRLERAGNAHTERQCEIQFEVNHGNGFAPATGSSRVEHRGREHEHKAALGILTLPFCFAAE